MFEPEIETRPWAEQRVEDGPRYASQLEYLFNRSRFYQKKLREAGFAASVSESPMGEQLCQQHCPVAHVAHEFPQLCEAETEAISRVLGRHVQRLATIAHGDGVCTTSIPHTRTTSTRSTSTSTLSATNERRSS